jgi:hypothetical protein
MKDSKRDSVIVGKILRYCDEIEKTHNAFNNPESAKLKIISCYKVRMNTKYFRAFC